VLVGHSLGGLVLKKLALEARTEAWLQGPGQGNTGSALQSCCQTFCSNLAGTFFFATPHGGAGLGDLAKFVSRGVGQQGPVLEYLTAFNRPAAVLNRQFSMAFPTLSFMALVETKQYKVRARPGGLFDVIHLLQRAHSQNLAQQFLFYWH
jgi:hypothetical protein